MVKKTEKEAEVHRMFHCLRCQLSEPRSCCQIIEHHQILRRAHLVLGREARRPRAPPGQQEKRETSQGPVAGRGSAELAGGAGDSEKAGWHVSASSDDISQRKVWFIAKDMGLEKSIQTVSCLQEEDEVQAGRQEADASSASRPEDQGAATSAAAAGQ